jgi:hypothetical protein
VGTVPLWGEVRGAVVSGLAGLATAGVVSASTVTATGLVAGAGFSGWQIGGGVYNIANGKPLTGTLDIIGGVVGIKALSPGYKLYQRQLSNERSVRLDNISAKLDSLAEETRATISSIEDWQTIDSNKVSSFGGKGSNPIDSGSSQSRFGSHLGESSGRPFYPDQIGLPISPRQLSTNNVRVTTKGVDKVEKHLSRFEPNEQNMSQLQRLRDIASGKLKATQSDLNNYTHELRESFRYKKLGYENGVPNDPNEAHRLWNNAHTATLEDYGLKEGRGVLYHPSTY